MRTRALAGVVVATWAKTAAAAPAVGASTPASSLAIALPNAQWPPAVLTTVDSPPATSPPSSLWPSCLSEFVAATPWIYRDPSRGPTPSVRTSAWPQGPYKHCPSGTLRLEASADGAQWKTLESAHIDVASDGPGTILMHECLPGTWTYQSVYAADDGTYKSVHSSRFTC